MPDPLTNLLRRWGEARSENSEKADTETAERISNELRRRRFLNLPDTPGTASSGRLVMHIAAVAAALLFFLAVAGLWLMNGRKVGRSSRLARTDTGEDLLPEPALFAPNPTLFREVNALFDRRLAWLADLPRGLEFSLGPAESSVASTARPVAVKFVLLTRSGEGSPWKPVWQGTVYTADDQWTEVRGTTDSVPRLALWVYPLEPGVFMIDSAVDLRRPVGLVVRCSRVVIPGQPVRLVYVDSGAVQYQLYQSVAVLRTSAEPQNETPRYEL
ncbi:MAG: hypothetical protein GXP31_08255 [Kiritimatiellaeota bacterium]|nr:hypothetical protein [Kiritimatiellota bacterium]